ncbi:uncharacterized protein N7500_000248 [Penicillium coprophilum]|uniref:uncharacterized protein n=1 Tax=Penicillium coprophilum TaxID=36646 RepID=UPI00239952CE|nr:uncharacterized protein N7500_000248 [Penicillium coprophilum]KAJ5177549.1 hypothetical protein N7500_000248 [Penicillium coprophilum]
MRSPIPWGRNVCCAGYRAEIAAAPLATDNLKTFGLCLLNVSSLYLSKMNDTSSKAHQTCGPCKKHKRKCDKNLPECSLCVRTGRTCDYDHSPKPPPTADEFVALQSRIAELEDRLSSTSRISSSASITSDSHNSTWPNQIQRDDRFPSALFLDADCYQWAGMRRSRPTINIPLEVLAILNDGGGILESSTIYFETIHCWMPIISRKRIDLGIPFQDGGPDLAMLFLAMKLATAHTSSSTELANSNSLYVTTKAFLATLEANSVVSLRCLQAMVLVALYEYSHSIYPAAWMTVGACSRYADMLELTSAGKTSRTLSPYTTWTEVEERRRVWWAIFILDRIISLGSRRRFSLSEPTDSDTLPVNDSAWNSGDVTRALNSAVSTPYSVAQSPFARLCQSALCISRAAESLDESLSLYHHPDKFLDFLAPRCLTWSALFMHLDNLCCPEKLRDEPGYNLAGDAKTSEEQLLQVQATVIVKSISDQVHNAALSIIGFLEASPQYGTHLGKVSPFVLDAIYCAMATYHWVLRESGDEAIRSSLGDIKECMGKLGDRWQLSLEYLSLEEVYSRATVDYSFMGDQTL